MEVELKEPNKKDYPKKDSQEKNYLCVRYLRA